MLTLLFFLLKTDQFQVILLGNVLFRGKMNLIIRHTLSG